MVVWPSLPVDIEVITSGVADTTAEGDDIPGIEPLLLDKAAPALGHDVALAAVPVGVAEAPRLSQAVLEAQQHPLLVGRLVKGEILLGVLLRDHKSVQLANIAGRNHLVKHVLLTCEEIALVAAITGAAAYAIGRTNMPSERIGRR